MQSNREFYNYIVNRNKDYPITDNYYGINNSGNVLLEENKLDVYRNLISYVFGKFNSFKFETHSYHIIYFLQERLSSYRLSDAINSKLDEITEFVESIEQLFLYTIYVCSEYESFSYLREHIENDKDIVLGLIKTRLTNLLLNKDRLLKIVRKLKECCDNLLKEIDNDLLNNTENRQKRNYGFCRRCRKFEGFNIYYLKYNISKSQICERCRYRTVYCCYECELQRERKKELLKNQSGNNSESDYESQTDNESTYDSESDE